MWWFTSTLPYMFMVQGPHTETILQITYVCTMITVNPYPANV